ncbi:MULTISPECIES: hypothetical protein [unclassified Rhodococcus (in: high G+C Gram-positive bacteria)]|uniref:hypothetical protein n=1 Tax=unclassified Rhodococcus (in: high G+C Gram-positive bacteria) TaxID=192944 RepID=UPI001FF782F4|nr:MULTISPECIES: hypothetical protein [unclassified Rhodococcus (in: high G+C Gram-positive bacteria)]
MDGPSGDGTEMCVQCFGAGGDQNAIHRCLDRGQIGFDGVFAEQRTALEMRIFEEDEVVVRADFAIWSQQSCRHIDDSLWACSADSNCVTMRRQIGL